MVECQHKEDLAVNNMHAVIIAVVFFVVAINFYMLFVRLRKDRRPKIDRAAPGEAEASKWRDKEIIRRLDSEQADAARRVELRNKTLGLYEQVRRNAADRENEEN